VAIFANSVAHMQKARARGLGEGLAQLREEVGAQGLALEALAAERDAARGAARDSGDRAKVC